MPKYFYCSSNETLFLKFSEILPNKLICLRWKRKNTNMPKYFYCSGNEILFRKFSERLPNTIYLRWKRKNMPKYFYCSGNEILSNFFLKYCLISILLRWKRITAYLVTIWWCELILSMANFSVVLKYITNKPYLPNFKLIETLML